MFAIIYLVTLALFQKARGRNPNGDPDPHDGGVYKYVFIGFATVSTFYSMVWDIAMDWSLGNPKSKNPFLRDLLGFQRKSVYYLALLGEPLLRFTWVLYLLRTPDVKQTSKITFAVSFIEVFRRNLWSVLRVENEHCTNVNLQRASRHVPLPYDVVSVSKTSVVDQTHGASKHATRPVSLADRNSSTGADVESVMTEYLRPSRRSQPASRRISRVGNMIATAHAEDFERRRGNNVMLSYRPLGFRGRDSSSDEDDDDDDDDGDDDDESRSESDVQRTVRNGGSVFGEHEGEEYSKYLDMASRYH